MKEIYHCVWDYSKDDENILIQKSVQFTKHQDMHSVRLIVDIEKENPMFTSVFCMASRGMRIGRKEFSCNELLEAEYLTVRASIHTIDLGRNDELFELKERLEDNRYNHRFLKTNTFYLGKPVKWGKKRHFVSSYILGTEHLFCDDIAAAVFSQYKAVDLLPVYHQRTGIIMDNVYYLHFNTVLPREAICTDGAEEYTCSTCGMKTWDVDDLFQLGLRHRVLTKQYSLAKTPDIWGSLHYPWPMNVISHEVYVMMLEKRLTDNLVFVPVVLMD